jgi:hypothetical protein
VRPAWGAGAARASSTAVLSAASRARATAPRRRAAWAVPFVYGLATTVPSGDSGWNRHFFVSVRRTAWLTRLLVLRTPVRNGTRDERRLGTARRALAA